MITPLALMSPKQVVGMAVAAPIATGIAISDEHVRLLALLVVTIATIVGTVAWIDARIKAQTAVHVAAIELHTATLKELQTSIMAIQTKGCARACHATRDYAHVRDQDG